MNKRVITSPSSLVYKKKIYQVYLNLFRHQNYQRFAVVGDARTGSNYLHAGLVSSNSIRMYHEIFAKDNREIEGKEFEQIFSLLFRKENRSIKAVGFKLFYNHLNKDEWDKFVSHKHFRILHLTRENRLRTIVSLDIAFNTDQWSASTNDKDKPLTEKRILLDTSELMDRLKQIQDYESLTRDRFNDRHILEVSYENLTRKSPETFQDIGEYLGIDDINLDKITLRKQNPESLQKLIVNYDEVYQLLKDTRFAEYLSG